MASRLSGATLAEGQPIRISVDTAIPPGPVEKVEFYVGAQFVGEHRSPIYSWHGNATPAGDHTLSASLIYANGAKSLSTPVSIRVLGQ